MHEALGGGAVSDVSLSYLVTSDGKSKKIKISVKLFKDTKAENLHSPEQFLFLANFLESPCCLAKSWCRALRSPTVEPAWALLALRKAGPILGFSSMVRQYPLG